MAITYTMKKKKDGSEDPDNLQQSRTIIERRELAKAENQMIPPELRPAFSEKEKNKKYLENMKKLRDRGKLG